MACRLVGAKPLPEPMLEYNIVNWIPRNKLRWILIEIRTFSLMKMHFKKGHPEDGGHFISKLNVLICALFRKADASAMDTLYSPQMGKCLIVTSDPFY